MRERIKCNKNELKVFYFGFDPTIDKAIEALLEGEYKRVASGFALFPNTRDLLFERKEHKVHEKEAVNV